MLTYKFKLYRTKRTKQLDQLVDIAGIIYNHCIALCKKYYKFYGKFLNKYKLQKHITKLKKKYEFWNNLGSQAIQNITDRIDESYKKFFKKQGGRPNFKKVKKYKSFTLKGKVGYKLKNNIFSIKGYNFKFFKSREIEGNIKTVTIKRNSIGDFYVCISVEKQNEPRITTGKSVGVDFGLQKFLTLSDGTLIKSPQYHLASIACLKAKSRALSRKRKGSNKRRKAKLDLARLHIKIANQRRDYFFKLANDLAKKYDTVFIEDLNLKAMAKLWGRKINDLAFNEFVSILSQRTDVVKIDRFYPSSKICSHCGVIKKELNLKDRTFVCNHCGFVVDRDLNASINIYRVGASTLRRGIVRPDQKGSPVEAGIPWL